jgi:general stress protein YciG
VAAADSLDETLRLMAGAIAMHLEGMKEDGERIPRATTTAMTLSAHLASIGRKGGKAAAARMTPEERHARAVKAGRAGGRPRTKAAATVKR